MEEPGSTRSKGATPVTLRLLLALGFVVAVAATVLAVLSEDARILRLAVVLALWAALLAAFAVTRSRRDAKAAALREGEAQLAYQLELHREVAARHEYEADLSVRMAAAQSEQIAELREQLDRLTEVLSSLADGELLVSRLTLSAESARFRAGQSVLTGPAAAQLSEAGRAVLEGAPRPPVVDVPAETGPAEAASPTPSPFVMGPATTPQPPTEGVVADESAAHDVVLGPEPEKTAVSDQVPVSDQVAVPDQVKEPAAGAASAEPRPTEPEQAPEPEPAAPDQVTEPGHVTEPDQLTAPDQLTEPEPEPEPDEAAAAPEPEAAREGASEAGTEAVHEAARERAPELVSPWANPTPAHVPKPAEQPQPQAPSVVRPSRHAAPDAAPASGADAAPAAAEPTAGPAPRPAAAEASGATPSSMPAYSVPAFVTPTPSVSEDTAPVSVPPSPPAPGEEEPAAVSVDELLAAYGLAGSPRRRRRE